jgi:cytochrome c553
MDWQNAFVALIILAAVLYVARRGFARLNSFRAGKSVASSCATGCGSCGNEKPSTQTAQALVNINGLKTSQRHHIR